MSITVGLFQSLIYPRGQTLVAIVTHLLYVTKCLTCMCCGCFEVCVMACIGETQAKDMFSVHNMNKHTMNTFG